MPIHLGKLIEKEVQYKRITQKEFGNLIHKNHKTVPDIYSRPTMSIELLIVISEALQKDFIALLYTEEPLKSMRNDEIARLNLEIKKGMEEINQIQKELTLTQMLVDSQKETITLAKEQLEHYKLKLAGIPCC